MLDQEGLKGAIDHGRASSTIYYDNMGRGSPGQLMAVLSLDPGLLSARLWLLDWRLMHKTIGQTHLGIIVCSLAMLPDLRDPPVFIRTPHEQREKEW